MLEEGSRGYSISIISFILGELFIFSRVFVIKKKKKREHLNGHDWYTLCTPRVAEV